MECSTSTLVSLPASPLAFILFPSLPMVEWNLAGATHTFSCIRTVQSFLKVNGTFLVAQPTSE